MKKSILIMLMALFTCIFIYSGKNTFCAAESAEPWMSKLDDTTLISEINIPGTHDTGTKLVDFLPHKISIAQCQKLTSKKQLYAGVRMFDLRCSFRLVKKDPIITHALPCYNKSFDLMRLSDIIKTTDEFFEKYPSETVIFLMNIGQDVSAQGTDQQLEDVLAKYIDQGKIWKGNYIPKLEEVRGKIVLLRRFSVSGKNPFNIPADKFGIDVSKWYSGGNYAKKEGLLRLSCGVKAWVQDHFECNATEKLKWFKKSLEQASDENIVPKESLVLNFSSATKKNPYSCAKVMNNEMLNSKLLKKGKKYGIIITDYITPELAKYIYNTNF